MTISTLDKIIEACTVAAFLLLFFCCWNWCHNEGTLNNWWWFMMGWMNVDTIFKGYNSDDLHF